MALETKAIAINTTGYTIIGTAIGSITARSRSGEPFSAVVKPTGGSAPLVGETDLIMVDSDGVLSVTAASFDAYALTYGSDDVIEVIRD